MEDGLQTCPEPKAAKAAVCLSPHKPACTGGRRGEPAGKVCGCCSGPWAAGLPGVERGAPGERLGEVAGPDRLRRASRRLAMSSCSCRAVWCTAKFDGAPSTAHGWDAGPRSCSCRAVWCTATFDGAPSTPHARDDGPHSCSRSASRSNGHLSSTRLSTCSAPSWCPALQQSALQLSKQYVFRCAGRLWPLLSGALVPEHCAVQGWPASDHAPGAGRPCVAPQTASASLTGQLSSCRVCS